MATRTSVVLPGRFQQYAMARLHMRFGRRCIARSCAISLAIAPQSYRLKNLLIEQEVMVFVREGSMLIHHQYQCTRVLTVRERLTLEYRGSCIT